MCYIYSVCVCNLDSLMTPAPDSRASETPLPDLKAMRFGQPRFMAAWPAASSGVVSARGRKGKPWFFYHDIEGPPANVHFNCTT